MKKLIIVFLILVYTQPLYSSWELILPDSEKRVFAIESQGNTVWIGTSSEGVYKSTDNGGTWNKVGLDEEAVGYIKVDNDIIYVGTATGLFYSDDGGVNWSRININDEELAIYQILLHNSLIVLRSSKGIYISEDNGVTWSERNEGLPSTMYYYIEAKDGMLYLGTALWGLFRTTNLGVNWEPFGFQTNDGRSYSVFTILEYGEDIYIGVGSSPNYPNYGIYKSADNGNNWEKISGLIATYMTEYNGFLLLSFAHISSFFISSDFGYTWKRRAENLTGGTFVGKVFAVNEHYESIFLITDVGLFRTSLEYVSVQDQVIKTDEYEINLYPNPADNLLNITFTSENTYEVSVSIYDILGKKVLELPQGQFGYSSNSQSIDISELSNGTYTFSINVNGMLHSKIFTVMRN